MLGVMVNFLMLIHKERVDFRITFLALDPFVLEPEVEGGMDAIRKGVRLSIFLLNAAIVFVMSC